MTEAMKKQIPERSERLFLVGENVVYRANGVCNIIDIRRESFGRSGDAPEYYILAPQNDPNSLLYVPVHNENLTSMIRPLLSYEDICDLIRRRKGERIAWIPESRARNNAFRDVLERGDREEVIVLLATVRDHICNVTASGKKVGSTDENTLRRAAKLLRDEFSPAIPLKTDDDLFALLDQE